MIFYPVTVLQEAGKITVWRLETGHIRGGIVLWQQWTFCFIPGICSSNNSCYFHINVTFRVNLMNICDSVSIQRTETCTPRVSKLQSVGQLQPGN